MCWRTARPFAADVDKQQSDSVLCHFRFGADAAVTAKPAHAVLASTTLGWRELVSCPNRVPQTQSAIPTATACVRGLVLEVFCSTQTQTVSATTTTHAWATQTTMLTATACATVQTRAVATQTTTLTATACCTWRGVCDAWGRDSVTATHREHLDNLSRVANFGAAGLGGRQKVPCRAGQFCAVPGRTVPCRTVRGRVGQCGAVPDSTMPCGTVLCRAVPGLCRAVPCRAFAFFFSDAVACGFCRRDDCPVMIGICNGGVSVLRATTSVRSCASTPQRHRGQPARLATTSRSTCALCVQTTTSSRRPRRGSPTTTSYTPTSRCVYLRRRRRRRPTSLCV